MRRRGFGLRQPHPRGPDGRERPQPMGGGRQCPQGRGIERGADRGAAGCEGLLILEKLITERPPQLAGGGQVIRFYFNLFSWLDYRTYMRPIIQATMAN